MLAAWRTGRRVFWRTSTRACNFHTNRSHVFSPTKMVNPMLAEYDAKLSGILSSLGAPVLDLRAIDMDIQKCEDWRGQPEEMSDRCRCRGFIDHTGLHPGPLLAGRQVARLLSATDTHCHL